MNLSSFIRKQDLEKGGLILARHDGTFLLKNCLSSAAGSQLLAA